MTKIVFFLALGAVLWVWWRRETRMKPKMPATEARALLGIGDEASLQDIREAHRRLIARVHPDAGGSAELATKVNAARDALVAELNRKRA